MKSQLIILSLLLTAAFATIATPEEMSSLWEAWKIHYEKSYSPEEELARFGIFNHNFKKVVKFNEENENVQLTMNKFADLTASEFKSKHSSCGFYESNEDVVKSHSLEQSIGALPASIDWRSKGAVTPVKAQGDCGSCWAFSTTGVLEGFNFINNGTLLSFSEQQLVDCDTSVDQGCDGGWPYHGIEYAALYGLETEINYPYFAKDGTCLYNQSNAHHVAGSYAFVTANSTDHLKLALVDMPVSVLVEADQDVFQLYKSGVITTKCGAALDHAVLVVGYHKVGPLEAYIVKNSWGTNWGEDGYVHIWTNGAQNGGQGVCGILAQPVIPQAK